MDVVELLRNSSASIAPSSGSQLLAADGLEMPKA